jgi:predicted metal-dependent peptidase
MALHGNPDRARRLRDWGKSQGFSADLRPAEPQDGANVQAAADWRNQMLRAMEAGRKAGQGIGRLGAILADLSPSSVPWEVHLRRLLAVALNERPQPSWRRPSGSWIARMAEADRHGGPAPVFEPGRQRNAHRPRIVIGLDTSSSIDAQTLRLFMAEAEAIVRRTGAEAHLLSFDEVVFELTQLDGDGWTALRACPARTGGGTDYTDLFEKAGMLRPSIVVILTDMDAPLPPAPRFPIVWAVPRTVAAPPFGRVIVAADIA